MDLKEDTSHKFALQIAENKRLQHHVRMWIAALHCCMPVAHALCSGRGQISRQKEETQKLYKQIEALQTRLLSVERELGSA